MWASGAERLSPSCPFEIVAKFTEHSSVLNARTPSWRFLTGNNDDCYELSTIFFCVITFSGCKIPKCTVVPLKNYFPTETKKFELNMNSASRILSKNAQPSNMAASGRFLLSCQGSHHAPVCLTSLKGNVLTSSD